MRVQKRPLKFFETKNIFIFEAGPNFGRCQKRRFGGFPRPQLEPQNTEKYQKINDPRLKNERTALARPLELTPRVVFECTHPRDVKYGLGMTFRGATRCG